jgi:outer membrane protein assembly factor BamE
MRKVLLSTTLALMIAGCSEFPGVYKIDIPQGNVVTQEMVNQLRPGMTHSQVRYIMGTPLITDTFSDGRWDYLYSIKEGGGQRFQERLTVFFEDGKLTRLSGDFRPGQEPSQPR